MIITVTIDTDEIPRSVLRMWSRWASVQRTMNESIRLIEAQNFEDVPEDTVENNIQELHEIGPALDYLHKMVRNQMWIIEDKEKMSFGNSY